MHGRKHILWGMCRFERHRHEKATRISPSDLDDLNTAFGDHGIAFNSPLSAIYDARANPKKRVGPRRLVVEYKAVHEDPSLRGERDDRRPALYKLMGGQLEMLESLSRVPNQQALIVFDPYWNDCSDERMDMTVPLNFNIVRDGKISKVIRTTIGGYSEMVWKWQWNDGVLGQPYFDYEVELTKAIARGEDPAQIVQSLRLPTW